MEQQETGNSKRFVVLDRDGVIIEDRDHLVEAELVELLPGAASAIRELRDSGFGIVVATNQSVIGRGLLDEVGLAKIHDRMNALLSREDAAVHGIYFCQHVAEDGCTCRKPATGLIEQAAAAHGFDPTSSFVIGDKTSDIEFGKRAGATTILVRTGYGRAVEAEGRHGADYVADDLPAAVAIIVRHTEK